ncbi:MAG: hypothetical protein IJ365_02315 [Clostridia bacterium]|nr:hypothetical protein [Clostridia bacterium]
MKILVVVLLIIGAAIAFGSSKIAPLVFKKEQPSDGELVAVKSVGFVIALVAAVIAFVV